MDLFWGVILSAALALNIIGGTILVGWLVRTIRALQGNITALEGTVKAQEHTLQAVGQINRTVLEVFKVLDPERWAAEVEVHKKFADARAAATIEQTQQRYKRELETAEQNTRLTVQGVTHWFTPYVKLTLNFLAYVPMAQRRAAIEAAGFEEEAKAVMLREAEQTPEIHPPRSLLDALASSPHPWEPDLHSRSGGMKVAPFQPPPDVPVGLKPPPTGKSS
jgi:hypothetical protein